MEDHALCPECVRAARKIQAHFCQAEGWQRRTAASKLLRPKVAHASIIAGHVPKGPSISRKWEVSEMEGSRALWLWWVEGGVAQAGHKWDQKEGEVDTDPPGKRNRVDTQFWKARKVWMKCHGSKNP
ncbi:hypothetical protein NEUTE1DRAFT_102016 [Neurospora tetrasperma FGSC 2508]|uniref:Uncharacterized protein n=1 Tax=Neurospora tetrasperma (strain FGSC 2508 / ATCC MYA-4615 / P0657) TaxID=510951 RepID=F8MQW7_NEUT8|nr:uncharacterized protein NEUTE1DRAFT_102016 [Neurospora tetrasperma FGSC 2508]EGO56747.1 hypothetical protein NEUTE1DRAFT_102016 [Neurospora tetrasperma FGSC 2508]